MAMDAPANRLSAIAAEMGAGLKRILECLGLREVVLICSAKEDRTGASAVDRKSRSSHRSRIKPTASESANRVPVE